MEDMKHRLQEAPSTTASKEVRGLPDVVSEYSVISRLKLDTILSIF